MSRKSKIRKENAKWKIWWHYGSMGGDRGGSFGALLTMGCSNLLARRSHDTPASDQASHLEVAIEQEDVTHATPMNRGLGVHARRRAASLHRSRSRVPG